MNENKKLSLDDFKKWVEYSPMVGCPSLERPKNPLLGIKVESKLPASRLITKVEEKDGDKEVMVQEFCEKGGHILESEDKRFCIQVSSGSFYVHRAYVSRA